MRTRAMFGLLIIGALVFCLAASQTVMASDEDEVLQVMENWYKAFNTSDSELMQSLWWHSPKLTTFGPDGLSLNEGWEDEGWKSTLDVPPGTFNCTLQDPKISMLTDDVAIITGYNSFILTDPTTKAQSTSKIRGTFVFQKIGGKWLIVHEHSSEFKAE